MKKITTKTEGFTCHNPECHNHDIDYEIMEMAIREGSHEDFIYLLVFIKLGEYQEMEFVEFYSPYHEQFIITCSNCWINTKLKTVIW